MKAFEATIYGRVQMVMFRDFAGRNARRLGIFGFVKNNADGSVGVYAEGERAALSEFGRLLRKGPLFAKVERIEMKEVAPHGKFEAFSILYE